MKIEFLKKYSKPIYVSILIFAFIFYFGLMGASGHQINISLTEKIGLILILCGIIIVPNYKNKRVDKIKIPIQILSLIISIGTIIIGIVLLKNLFGFKFGDDISSIAIGLFYLIPLIFIIANGIIINGIVAEMRK